MTAALQTEDAAGFLAIVVEFGVMSEIVAAAAVVVVMLAAAVAVMLASSSVVVTILSVAALPVSDSVVMPVFGCQLVYRVD